MVELIFPQSAKKYMELQCNSVITDYTDCPEVADIADRLSTLNPARVLELGAGLGRVSVFLRKLYDWSSTNFYLLDGNSGDVQIAGLHEQVGKDFYNLLEATSEYCLANGITKDKLHLINAEDAIDLKDVQFDLCYSFKSIGFHWPINHYLDTLHKNLRVNSYLFFELRDTRKESYPTEKHWKRRVNFVKKQLDYIDQGSYRIVEAATDRHFPILVLKRV